MVSCSQSTLRFAQVEDLQPCSGDDLAQIEKEIAHPLPRSYRSFLTAVGRGAGHFMSDLSVFFPDLLDNTETMRKIVGEYGEEFPNDAFVVTHRYGDQMLYLLLNQPHDVEPLIFRWSSEEPHQFTRVFDSLWEWIEEELVGHEYMNQ